MSALPPSTNPAPATGTAAAPAGSRYGVFLNVEDPDGDPRDALAQTLLTGELAEALGFHSVWVAEHHHSRFAIGSALMVLLAQLAARTRRIRLGTGAALLPLNDPVRVAEDMAALDLLSGGRMEFGVARGGPFPAQYRHAGVASEAEARERLLEALAFIRRLWREDAVDFEGRHYRSHGLSVHPRPLQQPVPVWLASLSPEALRLAAQEGHGLMATPSADLAKVAAAIASERGARPQNWRFAIARFFHCEPDHDRAVAHGLAAVRAYPQLMGVEFGAQGRPPMFRPDADDDTILANAVIGDPAHCAARLRLLQAQLGPHLLLLKPAVHAPAAAREALSLFMRDVALAV